MLKNDAFEAAIGRLLAEPPVPDPCAALSDMARADVAACRELGWRLARQAGDLGAELRCGAWDVSHRVRLASVLWMAASCQESQESGHVWLPGLALRARWTVPKGGPQSALPAILLDDDGGVVSVSLDPIKLPVGASEAEVQEAKAVEMLFNILIPRLALDELGPSSLEKTALAAEVFEAEFAQWAALAWADPAWRQEACGSLRAIHEAWTLDGSLGRADGGSGARTRI